MPAATTAAPEVVPAQPVAAAADLNDMPEFEFEGIEEKPLEEVPAVPVQ